LQGGEVGNGVVDQNVKSAKSPSGFDIAGQEPQPKGMRLEREINPSHSDQTT